MTTPKPTTEPLKPCNDALMWGAAYRIAHSAMGNHKKHTRAKPTHHAEEDPLAWHCLAELIVQFRGTEFNTIAGETE